MNRFVAYFLFVAVLLSSGCGTGRPLDTTASASTGTPGAATAISASSLPVGTVGTAYSAQLTATTSNAPLTWSIATGTLPPGLTLNSNSGLIAGTPGAAGSFSFTVKVTDVKSNVAQQPFTISIMSPPGGPIVIMNASLPNGAQGSSYSVQFSASGGFPPFTWSVPGGSLPAGLTLNSSTGLLSGTPTANGTFSFTIRATDTQFLHGDSTYTLFIATPLAITTSSIPAGVIGQTNYQVQFMAAGGNPPYTWSVSAGSIPSGTSLNSSSGLLSGTPTASSNFTFTVRVTDASGIFAQQQFTASITGGPAVLGVFPFSGNANGGETITIAGLVFQPGATVTFGGAAATNVVVNSANQITATSPPHADGRVDVVATNPDGHSGVLPLSFLYGTIVGCATDCGNVGDAYGGLGPPPNQTPISSCNTNIMTGGNFILTQNIGSDATAMCLKFFFPSSSINLDLGGFTVTGQVDVSNTNQGLNVVQHGTINCSNGFGCLFFPTTGRIHHLTITNSAGSLGVLGSLGISVLGTQSTTAQSLGLRIDHNNITITATPNANRTQAISISGANGSNPAIQSMSTEINNNSLTCSDNASACQGIQLFDAVGSFVHNNTFALPANCPQCLDSGRGVIFDQMGFGEFSFNSVLTRNNRGVRARSQFPLAGTISVHDNAFQDVLASGREGAVVIGENDNNINTVPADIFNNTFELGPSGNGVISSAATNVKAFNNTVSCLASDCSTVGFFGVAQVPSLLYGATGTVLVLSNNDASVLTAAGKPASLACASPPGNPSFTCAADFNAQLTTTVISCNSGTAVGNGTIVNQNPPCP